MTERPSLHTCRLGVGLAIAIVMVACSPGTPPSPSGAASTPASSADAANATAAARADQTTTDWGRIWDALPGSFPMFPGATPADDAASDVVSATYALEGADARTVAGWMETELERATYATESMNGPFEDGSFVLESTGPSDCRVQVSVAPLGGLTTIGVRYGAGCPAP